MPTDSSRGRTNWTKRIDRATELAARNPWAKEVLDFYRRVLQFQAEIYERTQVPDRLTITRLGGVREAVDLDAAAHSFPRLVAEVQKYGPPKLAEEAGRLRDASHSALRERLQNWLRATQPIDDSTSFLARVLYQPQAERLAQVIPDGNQQVAGNQCPHCHSSPQLAVLRPEGDGGKRMLQCALCQSEWEFRRVLCPACGEVNHEKLPRYSAEGITAVRVEACDTCHRYLKSIDMTVDGLAVPEVDEIATAPLDLWAAERGYRKIQLNLMGF